MTFRLEETADNGRISLPILSKEEAWEVNLIIPYNFIHRRKFSGTRERAFASSKTKQHRICH